MKVRLRTFILGWVALLLLILWMLVRADASFADKVDLHGGSFSTKSMSIWQLHKFKDTTLMRKEPLIWCPFRAYQLVDQYVTIDCHDNKHWLNINADLIALLREDAEYNKAFAKKFKTHGTRKQQVRQIYRYCTKTTYVRGKKYAKDVFTLRQGDCAAVSAAFYVLCKAHGIPVRYVIGWTNNSCHAWNRVKLKGRWYWVDCTQGIFLTRKLKRKIMCKW